MGNVESYRAAVQYWADLIAQEFSNAPAGDAWFAPWATVAFDDGTEFLDGNPIYSACSEMAKRGLIIQQLEPEHSDVLIRAWTGSFGESIDPDAIETLTIACELSEESAHVARDLIHEWIAGAPREELERLIDRCCSGD